MRTSCIRLRAKSRIAVLYEDFLEILDGNMLAALLLAILVYWTDIKINKKESNLWIWKSHADFQDDLMFDKPGMKPPHRTTIKSALDLLVEKKFIYRRKNPKLALDQTKQYLVDQKAVQVAIDALPPIVVKATLESRNTDNATSEEQQSMSENRQSIAEKPTSNTNDYDTEITNPEITEGEGTGASAPNPPALFSHPIHSFLSFDSLTHPTLMVITFEDDEQAEITNDGYALTADAVEYELLQRGFPVQVRTRVRTVIESAPPARAEKSLQEIAELREQTNAALHELEGPFDPETWDVEQTVTAFDHCPPFQQTSSSGFLSRSTTGAAPARVSPAASPQQSGPRQGARQHTFSVTGRTDGAASPPRPRAPEAGEALSERGAAVKAWLETLQASSISETPGNVRALNALGRNPDVSYESLKLTIAFVEGQDFVKKRCIAIDAQRLADVDDKLNLSFEKNWPLARRRQRDGPGEAAPARKPAKRYLIP